MRGAFWIIIVAALLAVAWVAQCTKVELNDESRNRYGF
jgi:hypothetical protein